MEDKVIKIEFNIWGASEEDGEMLRQAIVGFINEHASEGRRVTARKVTQAIHQWKNNALIRNVIINYFK